MQTAESILITGAGGYIGSWVTAKALFKGFNITALDTFQNGREGLINDCQRPNLKILTKEVRELTKADLEGIDRIIHLAAIVGTEACEKSPLEALRVNYESTVHLCRIAEGRTIYFTNTNIGYPQGYSDETAELKPENTYAKTKIEAERMILINGGVSLRLASVFGISPKMRHDLLLHYLVREKVKGGNLEVFDVHSSRNFIHLDDVAAMLIYPMGLRRGEAYNLALEKHWTKAQILTELSKLVPHGVTTMTMGKDPDNRDYQLSVEKIKRHAGFEPRYSVEGTLPELVRYYEFAHL